MEEKVLFESNFCLITYNEVDNFLSFKRIGFNTIEQIQEALEELLKALAQTNVKKYIIDDRETKVTPQNAQNWLTGDFINNFPSSLEKIAWVNSKDVFQQAVIQKLTPFVDEFAEEKNIEFKIFQSFETAKDWLK